MHNTRRRASTEASISSRLSPSINRCSRDSTILEDVLADGDHIGQGLSIHGEQISLVQARDDTLQSFRVIRKLGTGSYAVVYLVQEVLTPAESFLDIDSPPASPILGREFALKCLSKLPSPDNDDAQMLEATIHQSLPAHPNVVTLYTTFQTSSYLFLVLEYVPGEDLFYFLEQARDHDELLDEPSSTPPTPSLLASLHPSQLLSYRRLRLVASMFSQMCDAVAHCHAAGVFHRDLKPENFMVTDERFLNNHGEYERKVIVKLTDFGLATRDTESGDMDCGSAPYMSFECHNNLTPTYATAPADVWSLGIVLINMLYHANPWLTTATGTCQSFDYFLREPIRFFLDRFPGMTPAVAEFFARRVFCLLDDSSAGRNRRITAEQFGAWAKDLPLHLGPSARRTPALAFQQNPTPLSPRPRSPADVGVGSGMLMVASVSQPGTRAPSPSYRSRAPPPILTSSPVALEHGATSIIGNGVDAVSGADHGAGSDAESDYEDDGGRARTTSSKRRKRAPRGKSSSHSYYSYTPTATTAPPTPGLGPGPSSILAPGPVDDRLVHLATASQIIAREASSLKKGPSASTYTSPAPGYASLPPVHDSDSVTTSRPELRTKKSSRWVDIFRRDSGSDQEVPTAAEVAASEMREREKERDSVVSPPPLVAVVPVATAATATAHNVTSILKGLEPSSNNMSSNASVKSSSSAREESRSWSSRGRRKEKGKAGGRNEVSPATGAMGSFKSSSSRPQSAPSTERKARSKSPSPMVMTIGALIGETPYTPPPVPEVPAPYRDSVPVPVPVSERPAPSSHKAPSIRSVASSASSYASSGRRWRDSTASSSASSTYTRYSNSNASVRSVSTAATSVSSGSWRSGVKANPPLPGNIKQMTGVPWELGEVPRQQFSRPKDHVFTSAPQGKAGRRPPPLGSGLDTISEKPHKSSMKPPKTAPSSPSFSQHSFSGFGGGSGYAAIDAKTGPGGLVIDTNLANAEMGAVDTGATKPPKTPKWRLWKGGK